MGKELGNEWYGCSAFSAENQKWRHFIHDHERNSWPWRDGVIKSFNRNNGIRRIVTWQLAGTYTQKLPTSKKLATGFQQTTSNYPKNVVLLTKELEVPMSLTVPILLGKAFLGLHQQRMRPMPRSLNTNPISQRKTITRFIAFFNQSAWARGLPKLLRECQNPYLNCPQKEIGKISRYG